MSHLQGTPAQGSNTGKMSLLGCLGGQWTNRRAMGSLDSTGGENPHAGLPLRQSRWGSAPVEPSALQLPAPTTSQHEPSKCSGPLSAHHSSAQDLGLPRPQKELSQGLRPEMTSEQGEGNNYWHLTGDTIRGSSDVCLQPTHLAAHALTGAESLPRFFLLQHCSTGGKGPNSLERESTQLKRTERTLRASAPASWTQSPPMGQ